jgi:hypothetical protein
MDQMLILVPTHCVAGRQFGIIFTRFYYVLVFTVTRILRPRGKFIRHQPITFIIKIHEVIGLLSDWSYFNVSEFRQK